MRVLDTSVLLAALDAADPDHRRCAKLIERADEVLVVPALVLSELDYWSHERLGGDVWLSFLEDILKGAYAVEAPGQDELQRTCADLAVGVVDGRVLALVERLGEAKLATLDHRHFGVVRPRHVDALRLLPPDPDSANRLSRYAFLGQAKREQIRTALSKSENESVPKGALQRGVVALRLGKAYVARILAGT